MFVSTVVFFFFPFFFFLFKVYHEWAALEYENWADRFADVMKKIVAFFIEFMAGGVL